MKIEKSQIKKFQITAKDSSVKIVNDQEELTLIFETAEEIDELIDALKSIKNHVMLSPPLNGQALGPYYYTGDPYGHYGLGITTSTTSKPNSNITLMNGSIKAESIYDPTEDKDLKPVLDSTEDEEASEIAALKFDGGNGTKEDPYLISTEEQLELVADLPNKYNSSTIKQKIRRRRNTNYNISHERELKNIKNVKKGDFATVRKEGPNTVRETVYEFDGDIWHMVSGRSYAYSIAEENTDETR